MKNIFQQMKTEIVIFFVLLILNTIIGTLQNTPFETKGEIIISPPIQTDSIHYQQTVFILNYDNTSIDSLGFVFDSELKSIKKDYKTILKKDTSSVYVSNIQGNISLLFNWKNNKNIPNISPINFKGKNLSFVNFSDKKKYDNFDFFNALKNGFSTNLPLIFIYLILLVALYFAKRRSKEQYDNLFEKEQARIEKINDLEESIKKFKEDNKLLDIKTKQKIDKTEKQTNELRNTITKIKLLHSKKCRDLEKENSFYKNLINRLIKKSKLNVDRKEFTEAITNSLKTFNVKSNLDTNIVDIFELFMVNDKDSK